MPIDFTTDNEVELDFTSPVEEVDNLSYTDLVAIDEASMAGAISDNPTEEMFFNIRRDLMTRNSSNIIEDIKARDLGDRSKALTTAMSQILVDPTLSLEERKESLRIATEIAGEDVARPIWKIFMEEAVLEYSEGDPDYARVQGNRFDSIPDLITANSRIEDLKPRALNTSGDAGSMLDFWGNVAEVSVPLNYAATMQAMHTEMFGEDYGKSGWITIGEITAKLQAKFASFTNGKEKYEWAKKGIAFLRNNPGIIKDSNGFESMIIAETIFRNDFVPGQDFNWDRAIDNFVGVLDGTVIGGMVVKAVKYPLRMMGILNSVNPELARVMSARAVMSKNPEALKSLGLSKDEVIRTGIFPATSKKYLEGAPSDIVAAIREIEEELAGIFKTYVTDNPTQARRIREIAETYGGGKLKINDTFIESLGGSSVLLNVVVGRTATSGYSTLEGALRAAKLRGVDTEIVGYLKRNKSGKLVETSDPGKGEFFYQFAKVEDLPDELPYIDFKDIRTSFLTRKGENTRYWGDVFSIFKKSDSVKLSLAEDIKQGVQAQIQRAGRNFDQLSAEGKEVVLKYIKSGADEGISWKWADAVSDTDSRKAMTNPEYVAYRNLRAVSDLLYHTENTRVKNWLKNNNYKAIKGYDSILLYGTRVRQESDLSNIKGVIDVSTGDAVELTKSMKKSIQAGTGDLYLLRSKETRGLDRLEYVYVDRRNKKTVTDIPSQPLPYIDGYIHRRYSDDFYIERVDSRVTVNGGAKSSHSDQTSVVGSAARESDAKELLITMTAEILTKAERALDASGKPFVTLQIRKGRETIEGLDEGEAAFQFAGMNGLLHKGTRGPILSSVSGIDNNLVGVLESIHSGMNKAAANLSIRPIVEKLEADFVKEFGGAGGFIHKNNDQSYRFPMDVRGFDKQVLTADKARHKSMMAAWEYINFLGKFEDPFSTNWRAGVLNIASYIDGTGILGKAGSLRGKAFGAVTRTLSKDPLDVLKGTTFTAFLALNPSRQLVVQLSQHMVLAVLDPKYVLSGRAWIDSGTLLYGGAIRHNKKLWKLQKAGLAKTRGLSVKKFTEEVDGWLKSGLPTGVDSQTLLGGMTFKSVETAGKIGVDRVLTHIGNVLKAPIRLARRVGFDAGEIGNLGISYHIGRRRLEAAGKPFTAVDIGAEARALSFGMNKGGEFKHQRGALKAITQFYSMQQKGALIIINALSGGRLGNRFFTPQEARRMLGSQIFLFGAEGAGIAAAVDTMSRMFEEQTGVAIDPEAKKIMIAGTGTYVINAMMSQMAEQEGTDINFSSLAPFGGATMMMDSVFDLLFSTNDETFWKILGASGSMLGRVSESFKSAVAVFHLNDPNLDHSDKVISAMLQLGRISSGINNYFKGSIALREGFFKDKHGNKIVRATAAEAWGRILFGFGSYDEGAYYRAALDKRELDRAIVDQAERTVAALNAVYTDNKDDDLPLLTQKLMAVNSWMQLADQEDKSAVVSLVVRKLLDQSTGDSRADNFIIRVIKEGGYGIDRYRGDMMELASTPEQKAAIRSIVDFMAVDNPETQVTIDTDKPEEQE